MSEEPGSSQMQEPAAQPVARAATQRPAFVGGQHPSVARRVPVREPQLPEDGMPFPKTRLPTERERQYIEDAFRRSRNIARLFYYILYPSVVLSSCVYYVFIWIESGTMPRHLITFLVVSLFIFNIYSMAKTHSDIRKGGQYKHKPMVMAEGILDAGSVRGHLSFLLGRHKLSLPLEWEDSMADYFNQMLKVEAYVGPGGELIAVRVETETGWACSVDDDVRRGKIKLGRRFGFYS